MPATTEVVIDDMSSAADAAAFRSLNERWITTFFTLEDEDRRLLGDPVQHIVEPGGVVLVARLGSDVVGCVGLAPHGDDAFELVKMAVDPDHQGHGTGRRLIRAAVDRARELGARRVLLETNSGLTSAVHLYETTGFRHLRTDEHPPSPYVRADVAMVLDL
ncbi:GNAT family N-acetyltransferase [Curtobacterium sp. MCJR17_055]|uniref:GNAT family N-acetyltransferase n=1 Tax=unclassified Curtobacterium TaxID=257496 RepID=UPI000D8D5C00|nr:MULTISPECIES: GNAT family N-acetyltransferase [unclassified Curtobacterium]PYY36909.1 GNAT family N-acetyltransferase [Curtobacterium sp. MCBD17_029]PYY57980.1 GNAT family N-acetyltransferase [Curtobacterium sp. MCPF17_015]PYY58431.1 GNAT family N-acetyltransferase [Curtobacterium sp. MCJR17_055]WIB36696.1 GNAT family N-acetyltransferase [Curtobacterium sp. MCJR17_043]